VRAKFPDLSAQEVIQRLTSTATDIGPPGRDDQCGYGLLNIVAALTADTPSQPTTPATADPTPTTAEAAPPRQDQNPAGSNTPLIAGGIIAALAAAGALAFALTRRRRNP
jgi:MYXO-CTERM domain-containing protein